MVQAKTTRLSWKVMQLFDIQVPAGELGPGDRQRLVMPRRYQFEWLNRMLAGDGSVSLVTPAGEQSGGGESFSRLVACLLHQRSTLANLSLRENILLPLLYRGRAAELEAAMQALPGIAARLDIGARLDEQAGERSAYMHGLIGLARVLLQKPAFIVVQDAHSGMQLHRLESFRALFCDIVDELQAGVLYLTASRQDVSGLEFCRSLEFAGAEEAI